jgi:hypothetical protein
MGRRWIRIVMIGIVIRGFVVICMSQQRRPSQKILRQRHLVACCPGQPLLDGKAATIPPALFGSSTAAVMALTRKGRLIRHFVPGRQGNSQRLQQKPARCQQRRVAVQPANHHAAGVVHVVNFRMPLPPRNWLQGW